MRKSQCWGPLRIAPPAARADVTATHPELLLLYCQIFQVLVLLLQCILVKLEIAHNESGISIRDPLQSRLDMKACMHLLVLPAFVCELLLDLLEHRHALQHKLVIGREASARELDLRRSQNSSLCTARNDHARQSLVFLLPVLREVSARQSSHSRPFMLAYFGTATSSVSRNSEFSTMSVLLTTSSKDRCDRLPLLVSSTLASTSPLPRPSQILLQLSECYADLKPCDSQLLPLQLRQ